MNALAKVALGAGISVGVVALTVAEALVKLRSAAPMAEMMSTEEVVMKMSCPSHRASSPTCAGWCRRSCRRVSRTPWHQSNPLVSRGTIIFE